eukprot:1098973_1
MLSQCLVVSNLLKLNIVKSETQIHFLQLRIDSTIDNNLHPNQCNHPEENHASSPQSFQTHCFLAQPTQSTSPQAMEYAAECTDTHRRNDPNSMNNYPVPPSPHHLAMKMMSPSTHKHSSMIRSESSHNPLIDKPYLHQSQEVRNHR